MKLSPETLALLKNFASISQSIHIKPGNSLKTVKGSRAVYGEATIPEKFEKEFGIEPGGHLSVPRKDLPGLLHRARTQN